MLQIEQEIKKGERFEFGKNWQAFLSTLNEERIKQAEESLCEMLEVNDLNNKHFLDIGSGSGLFSLAAYRLGASVYSFDYDPKSVACTLELRKRYASNDSNWVIEEGSALDEKFLSSLGKFDIVYSWGVLHHTGKMWQALENAGKLVEQNGILFIAIYNGFGWISKFWQKVKKTYCSGFLGRVLVKSVFIPYYFFKACVESVAKKTNIFSNYKKNRGMSICYDWFDWLGGYPYEFAKVEEIFHFYRNKGFSLINIKTTRSTANNQFVFKKI